jgi:hypothetical protein
MTKYMGTWISKCRNVGKELQGRRGTATVTAENLESAIVEIRKAGARALFNGACGMWPNFGAEAVRPAFKYVGTWVCCCHNAELHGRKEKVTVTARSEREAKNLIREEGAIELFDGNREMRQHFRVENLRVLENTAIPPIAVA